MSLAFPEYGAPAKRQKNIIMHIYGNQQTLIPSPIFLNKLLQIVNHEKIIFLY